jgi:hypothetical protein
MNTKAIIGVSILAVVLIVLGSQANVVGYQTVQSSVKQRLNEKELLFQTICDLSNNKEVQKAILESQGKFQNPFPTVQLTSFPTITKRQLNLMYFLGVVLFKMIGKARMESLVKAHPLNTQTKDKINTIIGSNTQLKEEMAQLSILNCPSCSGFVFTWHYPVVCLILLLLSLISDFMTIIGSKFGDYMLGLGLWLYCDGLASNIGCFWWHEPPSSA